MITFILFINFLLRAIDRFLGKGLDLLIILEYLFLNLAWIIALSIPMAMLLATLATFGRLSEDNEINALISSGISFVSILNAPLLFGFSITILLIGFNNYLLPEMNFKARLLSGDIYKKRPDISIEPGVFLDNIPNYNMIISDKNDSTMINVRIFSKGKTKSQTSIYAKTGNLSTLSNGFLLTLNNGEIHEIENKDYMNYRRILFETHKILIPADDIILNRRDSSNRTDREMTVPMIIKKIENYDNKLDIVNKRIKGAFYRIIGDSILPKNLDSGLLTISVLKDSVMKNTSLGFHKLNNKHRQLRTLERQLKNDYNLINSYKKGSNKYKVEAHKKFSIPIACILFVLLGAPLGILANRGGFAISTAFSFGFFLLYYILLITGEELSDRNHVSPTIGMWAPNVVLLVISSYLIIYVNRARAPISFFKFFRKSRD
tara:strand:+ start:40 stop:1338 length:1299 start_codon:yes stop_codon:yes gene_type:complete